MVSERKAKRMEEKRSCLYIWWLRGKQGAAAIGQSWFPQGKGGYAGGGDRMGGGLEQLQGSKTYVDLPSSVLHLNEF